MHSSRVCTAVIVDTNVQVRDFGGMFPHELLVGVLEPAIHDVGDALGLPLLQLDERPLRRLVQVAR